MIAATSPYYPAFVGNVVPHPIFDGIIENMDGGMMYAAEVITLDLGEAEMSNSNSYIDELLRALKITWPLLVVVIASSYGFFSLTQSRIDSQMAEVRAQIASDRKDASSDNATLRSDLNNGFNRVADKIDELNKTISSIQVEQATQKQKLKHQVITDPAPAPGFLMPLPRELRRITQQTLVNDIAYRASLCLQPFDNSVTVNCRAVDYQLNNSPADFTSDKRCTIFQ